MPDKQPSRATRLGDFEGEALVHLDEVYRFARSLTREAADAEDLTQETFLQACKHWDQFTPGTNARAWLFTICRNLHYRQRERLAREEPADLAELESLAAAAVQAALAETDPTGRFFEAPELAGVIQEELRKLPTEFMEVVVLADLHDQSYGTIAEVLGVPVGTVKSRLFRGRRLLQEALIEYARDAGLVPPAGGAR